MHAAGNYTPADIFRLINLVQVSSAFGRFMDAGAFSALLDELAKRRQAN